MIGVQCYHMIGRKYCGCISSWQTCWSCCDVVICLQRFFPSEFGNDVDRTHAVDEGHKLFDTKVQIRRTIEAEGIPYTYVVANFFAGHFLPTGSDLFGITSPLDTVVILGDGNTKCT